METARLIVDEPADGAWNMAVDQALLETANDTGLITLRFYQWKEPTLSLGYFQSHLDRSLHSTSLECPWVRRRTGGGAILHDQELTYSLCVPSKHRWSRRNEDLYRLMHKILIEIINCRGATSSLFEDGPSNEAVNSKPVRGNLNGMTAPRVDPIAFMCFERRSAGDIVLDGYKVVGSAQRRVKQALLQHGSILLAASPKSPELMGIRNLSGYPLDVPETIKKCSESVSGELLIEFENAMLSASEKKAAELAMVSFFGSTDWNEHR